MEWVRAAALVLAAAVFAAALCSLGGAFSDRLDLLTHFTPFWLAGAISGLALALVGRSSWPTSALALAALIICLGLMLPEWLAGPRPALTPRHGPRLKLIQFNLWSHNSDPAGTAAWIVAQAPDIVTAQEASGAGAGVVVALAATYPYRVSSSSLSSEGATVILSKTRPAQSGPLFGAEVPRFAGAWARYGEGATGFTVVAVHYAWPTHPGRQQMQSRKVAAFLRRLDPSSLIVSGDFNSTPWSFGLRAQDARFGLTRVTRGLLTWPTGRFSVKGLSSPVPFLPIDHVYVGSAWRLVSAVGGPPLGSDHRPVIVELEKVGTPIR